MTPDQVPPAYVQRVAFVESRNNPLARAKSSTATGLFQFTLGTWEWLRTTFPGLKLTREGRTDPAQSERALRQFTALNGQAIQNAIGRQASMSELYLAHFLGNQTAIKILRADPGSPCAPVVGAAVVRANASIFAANKTCGALRQWARSKVPDVALASSEPPAARNRGVSSADDLNRAELERVTGDRP